jgi:hypothetical protein
MNNLNMKKITLTITLLLIGIIGISQNSPKEKVSKFFNDYTKEGSSIAIDNLYSTNKWMARATDAISSLKSKMDGLNEDYVGKYYGYELIVEKKLSDSYVLISYLVKFDRQPLRFTFQFYKPNDVWLTYGFQFDGNLDTELEEAAKLYYLKIQN